MSRNLLMVAVAGALSAYAGLTSCNPTQYVLEVGDTHNGGRSGGLRRDRLWLLEAVIKVIKVPKVIFAHLLFFGEVIKFVCGLGIRCLIVAFW